MLDSIWDIDMPRECPHCGEYFDMESPNLVTIEVEGYSECLHCLASDPEILSEIISETDPETLKEWKEHYPDLFPQHLDKAAEQCRNILEEVLKEWEEEIEKDRRNGIPFRWE